MKTEYFWSWRCYWYVCIQIQLRLFLFLFSLLVCRKFRLKQKHRTIKMFIRFVIQSDHNWDTFKCLNIECVHFFQILFHFSEIYPWKESKIENISRPFLTREREKIYLRWVNQNDNGMAWMEEQVQRDQLVWMETFDGHAHNFSSIFAQIN